MTRPARFVVSLCLAGIFSGCVRNVRPMEEWATPKYEHVFLKPLDEALAVTRKLLEEKGFTFEEVQSPGQLLTRWKGPDAWGTGDHTRWRYLAMGIAVGPRQSVVRLFQMKAESVGNDVELRDLAEKLELEAAAHQESVFQARPINRMRDRSTSAASARTSRRPARTQG